MRWPLAVRKVAASDSGSFDWGIGIGVASETISADMGPRKAEARTEVNNNIIYCSLIGNLPLSQGGKSLPTSLWNLASAF